MTESEHSKKQEPSSTDSPKESGITTKETKPQKQLSPFQESIAKNLKSISTIYETVEEDIMSQGNKPKFPTGLQDLDEILWGLHKRQLVVIGGYPKNGKSDFMVQLVIKLADTFKKVLIFSLEMAKEQVVRRMFCNICRIDNIQLRNGNAKDLVKQREETFLKWSDGTKIQIDDKHGYTLDTTLEVCRMIKPDFIFIDYIQMVRVERGRSKLESIEEYVRAIKQFANENNIGIILLSQRNKDGDMKWGGVLEEHPDTVIYVDWKDGKFTVDVRRQRHGYPDKTVLKYLPKYSSFEDFTPREKANQELF